tara:strand:+ start:562 stop:744 length:183 start_codon:yes stop_codon:yes gene_type:complete
MLEEVVEPLEMVVGWAEPVVLVVAEEAVSTMVLQEIKPTMDALIRAVVEEELLELEGLAM